LNDWDIEAAKKAAAGADVAFVFSNADSGEEYIDVDGNVGDRKNITLWHNGDALVSSISLQKYIYLTVFALQSFRSRLLLMSTRTLLLLFTLLVLY
jgi:hypothetical protein